MATDEKTAISSQKPAVPEEKAFPEREQTDESLRAERRKADDVLSDRAPEQAHEGAHDITVEARNRTDAVLAESRAKLAREVAAHGFAAASAGTVEADRRRANEALRDERAAADAMVRRERAHDAALLVAEREETDKDLSRERSRADVAVAMRDDFLGTVSHELRNMLGTVIGFARLIEDAESGRAEHDPARILTYTERIQRSGARMNGLIGDMVDVASIEAGALAVKRIPGDPCDVVLEAVEMFQTQASAKDIRLVAETTTRGTLADLDSARILQVVANLLGNALKFTARGGHVVVRTERVRDELRVSVHDTGIGIPADMLEAVFERFRQLKSDDRRGIGLGLYISRCIIQGHDGHIWAESREGEGSSFFFTLPVHGAG